MCFKYLPFPANSEYTNLPSCVFTREKSTLYWKNKYKLKYTTYDLCTLRKKNKWNTLFKIHIVLAMQGEKKQLPNANDLRKMLY